MRSIKGVKVAGVLLLVALGAAALAWYVTVRSERERYLTGRNFRLLAAIATQLDNSIDAQARTFNTMLEKGRQAFDRAKDYVPILTAVDAKQMAEATGEPSSSLEAPAGAVMNARGAWLRIPVETSSDMEDVWVKIGGLLGPIFDTKLRDGAFDTLALASSDGRVLYAEGLHETALKLARLDQLEAARRPFQMPGAAEKPPPSPPFPTVARASGVIDVRISGAAYKLFTQPCCLATPMQPETAAKQMPGLVLVGLVDAAAFGSKAREIPPTVVTACVALILMGLAAWPFLKLRLIGERQRIRRIDVVQVIAGGLSGIAILTICFVDGYVYWHTNEVRDEHLSALAEEINSHATQELSEAREQLKALASVAVPCAASQVRQSPPAPLTKERILDKAAAAPLAACAGGPALTQQKYPRFKTMSVIDAAGQQQVKVTSRVWQPEPIKVPTRAYFTEAKAGRLWYFESDPVPRTCVDGYVLESIWSWTTAEPEAVISRGNCDNQEFPVSALTIPMTSLIDPVVPLGFEFAVITEGGDVVFHSDPQRNTHENLFEETDRNRRLRAAVASRIVEEVDLRYAGRSYRAHVRPLRAGTPWFLVTLSSNEPVWALHTEWLVLSLAILVPYMLLLAAMFAFFFFTRRADWLWADARQVGRYRALSVVVLALLAVSAFVLWSAGNTVMVAVTAALPLVGWGVCYAVVSRQPVSQPSQRDAHPEYALLTLLLFLLTGVVPATGFLTASHRLNARADVKSMQLQFAHDLASHDRALQDRDREYPGVNWPWSKPFEKRYDLYHEVPGLLKTERVPRQAPPRSVRASEFTQFVAEELLPYYSERSVQIRELLLHDRADDGAWWWQGGKLFYMSGPAPVTVSSPVPGLLDSQQLTVIPGLLIVIALMMLAALTWAVVRFIEVHVCLLGVDQPLWSRDKRAGGSGGNLFVVCDPSQRPALSRGMFTLESESKNWSLSDNALLAALMDRDRREPGCPVLLGDLGEQLDNRALVRRKLAWMERLAADPTRSVIVLSSARPGTLDQALRAPSLTGDADVQQLSRWRDLLAAFVVLDWRSTTPATRASAVPWWREALNGPEGKSRLAGLAGAFTQRGDRVAREVLDAEARADAFVRAVCDSIEGRFTATTAEADTPDRNEAPPAPSATAEGAGYLSAEQVLDEVADRADAWYARIWRSCSDDEKLVLSEIAAEGFVNYKSRRTVRRLMARGLAVKDPSFRLMNQTFRRFVLSAPCQHDIRAIEGAADPSPWDRFRAPFLALLVVASLFFVLTQQELFTATITTLTTVLAGLPVLVRVVSLLAGKRAELELPKV